MSDINQYDIPRHLLLLNIKIKKADKYTNIGKAEVFRTVFGRAKVRVVKEQRIPRQLFLLALLALTVIAAAILQEEESVLIPEGPKIVVLPRNQPVVMQLDPQMPQAVPVRTSQASRLPEQHKMPVALDSQPAAQPKVAQPNGLATKIMPSTQLTQVEPLLEPNTVSTADNTPSLEQQPISLP